MSIGHQQWRYLSSCIMGVLWGVWILSTSSGLGAGLALQLFMISINESEHSPSRKVVAKFVALRIGISGLVAALVVGIWKQMHP